MKNYSIYKKTTPVYFSGEIAYPLGFVLLASIVSYGLFYIFGVGLAIAFNIVVSFCVYFYLFYYGKSNTKITLAFVIGFLLILSVLLFVDYGVYLLVLYQKTGVFNDLYFQMWLATLLGIPAFYYGFQYGRYYFLEWRMAENYLRVSLDIDYDRELLTYIDAIEFANTSKHRRSNIKLDRPPCFYSETELAEMESCRVRNYNLEKSAFSETIHIPFAANRLKLSWYSLIEDEYYDIELDFPFEKLILEKQKYPTNVMSALRGKKTKPLTLHIYIKGGVRIFNSDTILIDHSKSSPIYIAETERHKKIALHRNSHEFYSNPEAFLNLIQNIRNSGRIEERFLIKNKLFCWGMQVSGFDTANFFEVSDVSCNEFRSEINGLETSEPRFLPNKIEVVYPGNTLFRWLVLRINSQKLFHCIKEMVNENEETPIQFELSFFEILGKTELQFTIRCNEKAIIFTDWEIQIDKARKQSMNAHVLQKGNAN